MTMESDTVTRTQRLVRWLKDKIEKRKDEREDHDPWWVTLMLDVGRPSVAVMILTMCAPGEHYLGVMAGWSSSLAWLTPATLTAYAGIGAVVATKRPQGAPGRATAVAGAILSILLAMTAQPVAHLYEQHLITGHRLILTVIVSCIPAAVFGHLLHLGAAAPKRRRTPAVKTDKRPDVTPDIVTDTEPVTPDVIPDIVTDTEPVTPDVIPDTEPVTPDVIPDIEPVIPDVTPADTAPVVRRTPDIGRGSLAADVRAFLTDNPDASNDELYAAMHEAGRTEPDNSFYIAKRRYEKKIGKVS